jgi:hypothetical protein
MVPYFLFGENISIKVHDNLDSEFLYRVILARRGALLCDTKGLVYQIMNGLPRFCLPSPLNIVLFWFLLFPPFYAYIINELVIRLIAFIGMRLLLRTHFLKEYDDKFYILAASFCFALLPYYSIYGLSIAGQPLILYAFYNLLKRRQRAINFIIIIIFPFYSSLVLVGLFILFALSVIFIVDLIRNRKVNYVFFIALSIMTFCYCVSESMLIYRMLFDSSFISHRTEWRDVFSGGFVANVIWMILFGQYHAASLHFMIIAISFSCIGYIVIKKTLHNDNIRSYRNMLVLLTGTATVIALFYGLYHAKIFIPIKAKITILQIYQWDRFYFLFPLIWYITFAISLSIIAKLSKKSIASFLIIVQLIILTVKSDLMLTPLDNLRFTLYKISGKEILLGKDLSGDNKYKCYNSWFSEKLYNDIKNYIGRPQKDYRVVSIGLDPMIALYNGYYVLDSYQNNYSLEYKHLFRRIIQNELDKSPRLEKYFDFWGSRCYIFTAENGKKLFNLQLNTEALRNMGGEYVLSGKEIVNYKDNNLIFVKLFKDSQSLWDIYLYKIAN